MTRAALLGDVRLRVSNDGGARWSEPSTQTLTCHDGARPPELLSAHPEAVDLLSRLLDFDLRTGVGALVGYQLG